MTGEGPLCWGEEGGLSLGPNLERTSVIDQGEGCFFFFFFLQSVAFGEQHPAPEHRKLIMAASLLGSPSLWPHLQ